MEKNERYPRPSGPAKLIPKHVYLDKFEDYKRYMEGQIAILTHRTDDLARKSNVDLKVIKGFKWFILGSLILSIAAVLIAIIK